MTAIYPLRQLALRFLDNAYSKLRGVIDVPSKKPDSKNHISTHPALTVASQFGYHAFNASTEEEVTKLMAFCLADALLVEHTIFYRLDSNDRLHASVANREGVVEKSQFKDRIPRGPWALSLEEDGYVYVPTLNNPRHYYILNKNGFRKVVSSGYELTEDMVERYVNDHRKAYLKTRERMDMLIGCLSVEEKKFGLFRADSFASGMSVLPPATHPEKLLTITAIVGNFASRSLACFMATREEERMAAIFEARFAQASGLLLGISHAIRNDITVIGGYWGAVKDPDNPISAKIDRRIKGVSETIDSFTGPVKEGKFLTQLRFSTVNINELLEPLRYQHVSVTIDPEIEYLFTDGNCLYNAINELVINAKRYGENIENLKIMVTCKSNGSYVIISVKDNGIGIENKNLERIFDWKYRVNNDGKSTGCGLPFFREIIERMGGGIRAKSEGLGKGSEFIIHLPIASSKHNTPSI